VAKVETTFSPPGEGYEGHLLQVEDLSVEFRTPYGTVNAVNGISYTLDAGETLAILGESGSGKSVSAQAIMGLIDSPPGFITSGAIRYRGVDLLKMAESERRKSRGDKIAMIFQDALTALNPVYSVGWQIGEMFRVHRGMSRDDAKKKAIELMDRVKIPSAKERIGDYPHQFSGGMRQRVMIAMALSLDPDILIADEPTTALDVTVQAQIMDLLSELQSQTGMGLILITHDLGVVAGLSDRVLVMYAGRAIEVGTTDEIFYETRHPYTLGLLASLPRLDDVGDEALVPIVGSPPSLIRKPSGCSFHPRCRFARVPGNCDSDDPALRLVAGDAHMAACHYAEDLTEVTIDKLRSSIDVDALTELSDRELYGDTAVLELEDEAVVGDVAVAEGAAHPGVTDFAEDRVEQWPADTPRDGEVAP